MSSNFEEQFVAAVQEAIEISKNVYGYPPTLLYEKTDRIDVHFVRHVVINTFEALA
jgi:hypothetical protein